MKENTCCFIGHRKINETEKLKSNLCEIIEKLIKEKNINTFLFGSRGRFNDFCYEIVAKVSKLEPGFERHISRYTLLKSS